MSQERLECDYLIIGGGAMGIAFADTLVKELPSVSVLIIDKHAQPGGHWNDAYPHVRLHQPSHFYGVGSRPLETVPVPPAGELAELATGSEVVSYFQRVVDDLKRTGRVRYFSKCEASEDGKRVTSLVEHGQCWDVEVRRKVVDASYMKVEVPSTHAPAYRVAAGALLVPPNALQAISSPHPRYVVIGSGKTGIDAVLWLLDAGVTPDRISWVVPRDAWLLNRRYIQPGAQIMESLILQTKAFAEASSPEECLLKLESGGNLLRLDESRMPSAYRCATVTVEECTKLRLVKDVIRLGHVQEVGLERLQLDEGSVQTGSGTLHIDCTADALSKRPAVPIFSGDRIVLQSIMICQQVFSAAFLAHLEASLPDDDARKNAIVMPVPHPDSAADFFLSSVRMRFNTERIRKVGMIGWFRNCRLSPLHHVSIFSALIKIPRLLRNFDKAGKNLATLARAAGITDEELGISLMAKL